MQWHDVGMVVVILVQSVLIVGIALQKGRKIERPGGEMQMRVNLDTKDAERNIDILSQRVDVLTRKAADYNRLTGANIVN